MSLFNNPNFITFAGEPITGRVPTNTRVFDREMTPEQSSGVAHAYKLFCDAVRVSPVGYHVQNRMLQDGSRVRMVSNCGVDSVLVWPAGSDEPIIIQGLFRGVPSSLTHINGIPALGPSAKFRKFPPSPMPDAPVPVGPLVDHPGHVTWIGKHYKLHKHETILSWRGPGSRYSASTGWSTNTGGEITGHELNFEYIGDRSELYKDSSFLWINGVKVNTGIAKLIAAALHRPDPTKPNEIVLRVCSDNYPQDGTTRGFAVFDLVPAGQPSPGPVSLEGIIAATGFVVLSTYPATQFSTTTNLPVTGAWVTRQRPHFNSLGDKLATRIAWRDVPANSDAPRIVAACFDPKTWTMLAYYGVDGTNTQVQTGSASYTFIPTSQPPMVASSAVTSTLTRQKRGEVLLAADFLETTFVYMSFSFEDTYVDTEDSACSVYGTSAISSTYSKTQSTTLKVKHSLYGEMTSRVLGTSANGTTYSGDGTSSWTLSVNGPSAYYDWRYTHLVGDLSQDVFAIGFPVPSPYGISYSGPSTEGVYGPQALAVPITVTRETVSYDVLAGGRLRARNTIGSYNAPANPPQPTTGTVGGSIPAAVYYMDQRAFPTYSVSTVVKCANTEEYEPFVPHYKHCAANSGGTAAYLGVALLYDVGGLELAFVIKPKIKHMQLLHVPPYADGTLPTIIAPIFLNPVRGTP